MWYMWQGLCWSCLPAESTLWYHVRGLLLCGMFCAADTNACITTPCTDSKVGNVTCKDRPAPSIGDANGRTCMCSASYVYDDTIGCKGQSLCMPCGIIVIIIIIIKLAMAGCRLHVLLTFHS